MNVGIVILGIIGILFVALWAWHKLKATKEGELIDTGSGTHYEYSTFVVLVVFLLFGFSFLLLIGLFS